jgi:hypothetical protein
MRAEAARTGRRFAQVPDLRPEPGVTQTHHLVVKVSAHTTGRGRVQGSGRGGEIRTHDPLYPKQVRYQTALRPDAGLSSGPKGSWEAPSSQRGGRERWSGERDEEEEVSGGRRRTLALP